MIKDFIEAVENIYAKEGSTVTNIDQINDNEFKIDLLDGLGGGFSTLGSVTITKADLLDKIEYYRAKPIEYTRSEYNKASEKAWEEKKTLLIYPDDMDLIVVDFAREEHCYLSNRTRKIDSRDYENKEKFVAEIKGLVS